MCINVVDVGWEEGVWVGAKPHKGWLHTVETKQTVPRRSICMDSWKTRSLPTVLPELYAAERASYRAGARGLRDGGGGSELVACDRPPGVRHT